MRLFGNASAPTRPFECEVWKGKVINASRDSVARFQHDVYSALRQ